MAPTSAAMELKVLINILSSGQALKNLLGQTQQLSTALTQLQQQANKVPPAPPGPAIPPAQKVDDTTDALKRMERAVNGVYRGVQFLAGGFLALQSVRFIKDLADTAARAEVLQTVLRVVGNNAGYTAAQVDKADQQIQSLGITAAASRQSLTQFIQAELDLAKAPELARAAQDAAVILGTNSSVAFERLVTSVQTSNTLMLRHMGIIVSADSAYQRYAQSIGKSVGQLTTAQRAQAFLNATLEQTRRIAGSYTAAMGDVGKQLTSIDRLTTDLKTSLGNNLLPAYLAIVEELTLFLQNMELVADSMYGQGEGAKKLGEDIKYIASIFRQAAEFVVKYRAEIATLVGLWLLVSKIAIPVLEKLINIQKVLAGAEVSGGLASIVAVVGFAVGAFALLGTAIIGFQVYSERFNAAIGTMIGALWSFLEVLDLVIYTITGGVYAAVTSLFKFMINPFSTNWLQPWKDWAKGIVDQIAYIGNVWDNTRARFQQAVGDDPAQATAQQTAQTKHMALLELEGKLLSQVAQKTREYNDIQKAGTAEGILDAKKQLDTLKAELVKTTSERKGGQIGLSAGELAIEDKKIDNARKLNDELALTRKLEDATKGAKFTYPGGIEQSVQFRNELGQFSNLLEVYNSEGGKARVTTQQLFRALQDSGAAVKTTGDLKELAIAVEDLRKAGADPTTLNRLNNLMFNATKQVADETRKETERAEKEREARFRNQEKRTADVLNHELDLLRTTNEMAENLDQQSYERRGMDLEEYFDRRAARTAAQGKKEYEIAQNALSALQRERDKNIPRTEEERRALDTRITEATQKLEELNLEIQSRMVALGTQREDARETKLTKSRQTLLDIAALYGDENEALAAINFKYDEMAKKANTAGERAAIQAEREQEQNKNNLKYRQQELDIRLESVRLAREVLDSEQAALDAERSRVQTLGDTGQITSREAMKLNNAILLRQIEIDQNKILQQTVELEAKRTFYQQRRAAIVTAMATLGKGEDAPETIARINEELGGVNKEIKNLETGVVAANAALENSITQFKTYSKEFKVFFVDSVSSALTESIVNFKKAGDAWVQVGEQIKRKLVSIFIDAFTERLFKRMSFGFLDTLMGLGSGSGQTAPWKGVPFLAEGGLISGPGTGTSDSIPAWVSAGEHIMPADKTSRWLPLLEAIRLDNLQSIAIPSVIPRRYAAGGVVVGDAGAASVQTGGSMSGNMVVSLHPDAMNMTMREWLEQEVVRQQGRR